MEKNVKFIRIRLCVRCVRMSECVSACVFFLRTGTDTTNPQHRHFYISFIFAHAAFRLLTHSLVRLLTHSIGRARLSWCVKRLECLSRAKEKAKKERNAHEKKRRKQERVQVREIENGKREMTTQHNANKFQECCYHCWFCCFIMYTALSPSRAMKKKSIFTELAGCSASNETHEKKTRCKKAKS